MAISMAMHDYDYSTMMASNLRCGISVRCSQVPGTAFDVLPGFLGSVLNANYPSYTAT